MFKNREVKEGKSFTSQFISYGVKQLKIVGITAKVSKKESARIQYTFEMETPAIGGDFEGFEGEDGTKAAGLIGRVRYNAWFNPELVEDEDKMNQFLDDITLMADKAGVREELDALPEDISWNEMIESLVTIFKDRFMWFLITAEEYAKGKFNLALGSIPAGKKDNGSWNFVLAVKHADFHKKNSEVTKDEKGNVIVLKGTTVVGENAGKVDSLTFDPIYHLKPLEEGDLEDGLGATTSGTGLPF